MFLKATCLFVIIQQVSVIKKGSLGCSSRLKVLAWGFTVSQKFQISHIIF